MEENQPSSDVPAQVENPQPSAEEINQSRKTTVIISIVIIILLALIGGSVYFLLTTSGETATRIRDIFIIFMALESLVIGVALVILIVQLATLINLLQNEIKPILNSTNETVNTVRGTVAFLSDNLAEPVITLNQYLAGFKKMLDLIRIPKR